LTAGFVSCLQGGGRIITESLCFLPHNKTLLQSFAGQTVDTAPKFPRLHAFLDHLRQEIEAVIHSIRAACIAAPARSLANLKNS
jgi:uncharacterized protein Usg